MNNKMEFPNTFEEFLNEYSFKDSDEVYTNGSELIQVFRVMQGYEHFSKQIKEKAYQQGKIDAIDSELMNDVYMRRTKLVYQEGINKGKTDGAREFAEWLATKRGFSKEWVEWHLDHWQKGAENE